jgi:hypothetical protein
MGTANMRLLALTIGFSAAVFLSQAWAQTEQRSAAEAERDAIIHSCVNQAHREYPQTTLDEFLQERTYAYKACMVNAGQQP